MIIKVTVCQKDLITCHQVNLSPEMSPDLYLAELEGKKPKVLNSGKDMKNWTSCPYVKGYSLTKDTVNLAHVNNTEQNGIPYPQ